MGWLDRLIGRAAKAVSLGIDGHARKALDRNPGAYPRVPKRTAIYAAPHEHKQPEPIEQRLATFANDRGILLPEDDNAGV